MKAVIAQSDAVTAYGWGIDALWDGLMSGNTAIKSSDRFANRGFVSNQAAEIPDLQLEFGESRSRAMLRQLLQPLIGKLDPKTTLILTTTVCEIEFIERAILDERPDLLSQAQPRVLLAYIKQLLGLNGPAMVLSSACASSSAGLTQAASLIHRGDAKAVLVVACDSISEFVYSGFSTLLSLCDTPAKPFDADRCGLSLGEAAAWALVVSDESSQQISKDSVAILGWGNTTDAVHMTAPDRAASGLSRAITQACAMASMTPDQIAFIAAHGTATLYNDAMELRAFHNTLPQSVPIFSVKGGIGHTLAAAGLSQILVAARAMSMGIVPPTVGLANPDSEARGWAYPTSAKINSDAAALSTNSGFGGVNTAIVLGPVVRRSMPDIRQRKSVGILSVAWFGTAYSGAISTLASSQIQKPQVLRDAKAMTALIGCPLKYFSRMTTEARACLAAASLAMKGAGWDVESPGSIGIVGTGYDGCITADQKYFRDYFAGGQSLGRANLFIYTLPTSAMSEVAIALTLTGPTLHLHNDSQPVKAMVQQAASIVEANEAQGILALYSDGESAICYAIGQGTSLESLSGFNWEQLPLEMCYELASKVKPR